MLNNIKDYKGILVVNDHLFHRGNLTIYYGLDDDLVNHRLVDNNFGDVRRLLLGFYGAAKGYKMYSSYDVNDDAYLILDSAYREMFLVLQYDDKIRILSLYEIFGSKYNKGTFNLLNKFVDTLVDWCKLKGYGLGTIYRILSKYSSRVSSGLTNVSYMTRNIKGSMTILFFVKTRSKVDIDVKTIATKCLYFELDEDFNKHTYDYNLYRLASGVHNPNVYFIDEEINSNLVTKTDVNKGLKEFGLVNTLYLGDTVGLFNTSLLGYVMVVNNMFYKVNSMHSLDTYDIYKYSGYFNGAYTKGINGIRVSLLGVYNGEDNINRYTKINSNMVADGKINLIYGLMDYLRGLITIKDTSNRLIDSEYISNIHLIDWDNNNLYSFYDVDVINYLTKSLAMSGGVIQVLDREGSTMVKRDVVIKHVYVYNYMEPTKIYTYYIETNNIEYLGELGDANVEDELREYRSRLCLGIV